MVELLELIQAGLMVTAVTLSAVALPVAVGTDAEMPSIEPLIKSVERITK